MQIGLTSRRALQGPGLWELIPSLNGRNRPPSFPAPPAAPRGRRQPTHGRTQDPTAGLGSGAGKDELAACRGTGSPTPGSSYPWV